MHEVGICSPKKLLFDEIFFMSLLSTVRYICLPLWELISMYLAEVATLINIILFYGIFIQNIVSSCYKTKGYA